jgi:DNA polymerase III alpha subunit (gram-positive type)
MLRWLKSELRRQELGRAALPNHTTLDSLRYVVLDTELTSLDSRSNRLLSIGAIAMDGPKIRLKEQFYRIVDPRVPIPPEASSFINSDPRIQKAANRWPELSRTYVGSSKAQSWSAIS